MTARYADFHHLIAPTTGRCPKPILNRILRETAIEYCTKTKLWRHDVTDWDMAAQDEIIPVPNYASIHMIQHVEHDGQELEAMAYVDTKKKDYSGSPRFYAQKTEGTLHIVPFVAGDVEVYCILKPKIGQSFGTEEGRPAHEDEYDQLPTFFLEQHGMTLAHGVIARALAMPEQEWTNPDLAAFHMANFRDGMTDGELQNQTRARIRTQTQWF